MSWFAADSIDLSAGGAQILITGGYIYLNAEGCSVQIGAGLIKAVAGLIALNP
jgi:hypothetical protein